MTLSKLRLALVAGVVAPLALATANSAQPAPQPGPAAAEEHHRPDPAEMRAHMAEHLRAALQLQPSQDAALSAFLDALKPPGGMTRDMRHEHTGDQYLTTPERLDRMLAKMDERRARFVQIAAATKQFYGALTPAQQRALDAMHCGHGDMMGGGRDRDHGPDQDGGREGPHEMGPDGQPHG